MRLPRARKALKQSMFILVERKPLVNPDYKTPGPAVRQGLVNDAELETIHFNRYPWIKSLSE